MACLALWGLAQNTPAAPVGVLNGASHDTVSAQFVDRALTELKVHLLIEPQDPFGAELETPPRVVLVRGFEFAEGRPEALAGFIQGGGRVIAMGALDDAVAAALGIAQEAVTHIDPWDLTACSVIEGMLPGSPTRLSQRPRLLTYHRGDGGQEAARWVDKTGQVVEDSAVTLFPWGGALSWEPQPQDGDRMAQLLVALIGRYDPEVLKLSSMAAGENIGRIAGFTSWTESYNIVVHRGKDDPAVSAAVRRAVDANGQSLRSLQAEDWATALAASIDANEALREAYALTFRPRDSEIRAVWSPWQPADRWPDVLDSLAAARINALFLEACSSVRASYPSDIIARAPHADAEGDTFGQVVEAAGRRGLDVHAWYAAFAVHLAPEEALQELAATGRLQQDAEGQTDPPWLCPGHPDNIALSQQVITELFTRYPIRGICLDYARFAGPPACYCDTCRAAFEAELGMAVNKWPSDVLRAGILRPQFERFRNGVIGAAVQAMAETAKQARPDAVVSVTVAPAPLDQDFGQGDWPDWLDSGLIDVVCALDYRPGLQEVQRLAGEQLDRIGGRADLCVSVRAEPNGEAPLAPGEVLKTVESLRLLGCEGFALWRYGETMALEQLPYLAMGATSAPAAATYDAPPVEFAFLDAPLPESQPRVYAIGAPVSVELRLPDGAAPRLVSRLEDLATGEFRRLRPPAAAENGMPTLLFRAPQGRYRLAVGLAVPGGGPTALTRSGVLEGVPQAQIAALQDAARRAKQVDVAVFEKGVGARSIARFLAEQAERDLAAELISDLSPQTLSRFDVLVLIDPTEPRETFTEGSILSIQQFVAVDGGGALLIHEACGQAGVPKLFPPVGGPSNEPRGAEQGVEVIPEGHAALRNVPPGQPIRPAFSGYVHLDRGAFGTPIVVAQGQDPDESGVVIVGEMERGRVALCGLGIGLAGEATRKREAAPAFWEAALLSDLAEWLGETRRTVTRGPAAGIVQPDGPPVWGDAPRDGPSPGPDVPPPGMPFDDPPAGPEQPPAEERE